MKNDLKVGDFIQCYSMKDLVDRHTELTKLGYKLSLCYEKTVKRTFYLQVFDVPKQCSLPLNFAEHIMNRFMERI
jgi:hypothetical protein